MAKFTFDNTIEEMLEDARVHALVEELFPEILDHPLLDMGKSFRFCDALPYVEEMLDPDKLEEFKVRLSEIQ